MKNLTLTLTAICFSILSFSQNSEVPKNVELTTLDFGKIQSSEFLDHEGPIVISFWATWCSPCKRELNAIAESYIDWQDETDMKLIAISIDDSRNVDKVKPYVDGQAWDYEVYLDTNGDFKRAMNVNNVPHTFLVNTNGQVVYQHNSYSPGDELHLYELVKKVANGESVH
jgi:cytochrome c biogenesis protein CcmG, thiol:disulfide interchange protein DsbE